ncbi:FdtA/QdtA family cupin domain-containing protein [Actinoplanes sp. N902-109]|uniref:sugar 3,4-ketoisomerase n=1 Tax=Actinoplanes sp. (strain N902-109) TaxID=649831 RepID=UPI000329641E|nr:FdtA/QdtA family cupin domain-containing protein [Actinoplanes sp. N902-109]AGL16634.1 WxcM domain-containing protein [Actinoplanes sp. N902-109]
MSATRQLPAALARVVDLPAITDDRGQLVVAEVGAQVPFPVERAFAIHDVPAGADRGGHAHREQHQLIIAVAGEFELVLDNERERGVIRLDRPSRAVHVPPMVWAGLSGFRPGTVCLVLASGPYREDEYYRDRAAYRRAVTAR